MPAPTYKVVELKVGDVTLYPLKAQYSISRDANVHGMRTGQTLRCRLTAWVDGADATRLSQADLIKLWTKATQAEYKPEQVACTWYGDDAKKVLMSVEFMGWPAVFETYNPTAEMGDGRGAGSDMAGAGNPAARSLSGYNNIVYTELVGDLTETHVSKHKLTK